MSKTKIILIVLAAVTGISTLVFAWFLWEAFSAKADAAEEFEMTNDSVVRFSRGAVFPCAESVKAIDGNREKVEQWCAAALKFLQQGDRPRLATTPAQFKEELGRRARRLLALPGGVEGRLLKPTFAFGLFAEYISGGKMPPEKQLAKLQREWDDLTLILQTLSTNGVVEVEEIECPALVDEPAAEKPSRKAVKKTRSAQKTEKRFKPSACEYSVTFRAKPDAFANAVNAFSDFSSFGRFVTVGDFTLTHVADPIVEALGESTAQKANASGGTSRRARRLRVAAAETAASADEEKKQTRDYVADPQREEPLKVVLKLKVVDFGSLEEEKEEGAQ